MQQPITMPQTMEQPHLGATFGLRAAAQIIDLLVHNLVIYVTSVAAGVIVAIYAMITSQSPSLFVAKFQNNSVIWYVFPLMGYVVYHTISEGFYGATLGKFIMKLHVLQANGVPCSPGAALIRSLSFYVDGIFFGLVAAFSMNRSELKQRYGDIWAHTIVVERSTLNQTQIPSGWTFLGIFLLAISADGAMYALSFLLKLLF